MQYRDAEANYTCYETGFSESVLAPTRMVFDDASSSYVLTFHETESNNHLEYHSFSNPSQTSPPPAVVFQFILHSPVHKHAQEEAKHVFF